MSQDNGLLGQKLDEFVATYASIPEVCNAWNKHWADNYPPEIVEVATHLYVCEEYGYLGATVTEGTGPSDWVAIVKLDENGNKYWNRVYGLPLHEILEMTEMELEAGAADLTILEQ